MSHAHPLAILALAAVLAAGHPAKAEDFPLGPDAQEQADVPKGTVSEATWNESKIFPGTQRKYWIYLPPAFAADQDYPLIVFQDGGGVVNKTGQWRAPTVLDNLIHQKAIPAMVGLFIDPGNVPASTAGGTGLSTRSFEYDTADDTYVRFLLEEMLPLVAKQARISAKPEYRAIAGVSSGGICAFTAAWFRPDAFRKVITGIGSFTNIRGGTWYPSAIRKTERKPLRIFLQEGEKDLDNVHGNWPIANHDLVAALTFAGYDIKTAWTDSGHNGKQMGSLLPDALRWIWRAEGPAPAPVAEVPQDLTLSGLLIDGQDWHVVVKDGKFVDALCNDADGNAYYSELGAGTGLFKIAPDGSVTPFKPELTGISGMKFGADGRIYACHNREKRVIAVAPDGKVEVLATDIGCNDLAVTHDGRVYVTETGKKQVVLIEGGAGMWKTRVVDTGIPAPNGLALSPDQGMLVVSDYSGNAAWAFRVEANGDLSAKLPVLPYRAFGGRVEGKGDGMTCDTRRRWYIGSQTGVQVYDPNGRPTGLVLSPTGAAITSCTLSGPDLGWLYVAVKGEIWRRKVNANGFVTSAPPIMKAPPAKK